MAYKFQKGAAHLDGLLSGSSTIKAVGSLSSSGDVAVTGNIHAAEYYGGGGNLTGISSDAVDVTSSTGDINYPIVFTQGAQSNGSLGLGLNTALNYNPSDGIVSSSAKLQIVGNSIFAGTLNVSGNQVLDGAVSSSKGAQFVGTVRLSNQLHVSSSQVWGGAISSSANISTAGNVAVVGTIKSTGSMTANSYKTDDITYGDGGITIDSNGGHYFITSEDADKSVFVKLGSLTADTNFAVKDSANTSWWGVSGLGKVTQSGTGSMADINMSGALSGSGDLLFQGGANLGSTLDVTGAISGANISGEAGTLTSLNLQVGGITNAGAIAGGTTGTFSSTLSGAAVQGEAGTLTSLNLQVGGITNAGAIAGGTTGTFSSTLSGAAVQGEAGTLTSLNLQVGGITNAGAIAGATTVAMAGALTGVTTATLSGLLSSSAGAQIVGNLICGGDVDISGGMSIGDASSDVAVFKATAYFAGPEKHKLQTITANSELTASSAAAYQIVSGGTSALTVIMPSASNGDYSYLIKRHSLMSGNVVIEGGGSELIDGNTNITLATVGASVFLISDGTQWNIF
jgi:hypothetical protein